MTGINDFLAFATGGSANVLSQADYAALTTLIENGYLSGIAESMRLNKTWRQSSVIANLIGAFMAAQNQNANDDGNAAALLTNFEAALTAYVLSVGSGARPIGGSFKNLKGVWASNTGATYMAGELIVEDGSGNVTKLSAFNETLATATSGAGGIDTGSIASSTWYNVFAIYNPTTTTANILYSLSATAPALPSGYTQFARIGSFFSDGSSHIRGFIQYNSYVQYVVGNNLANLPTLISGASGNTTTPVWTAAAIANFVPPTAGRITLSLTGNVPISGGQVIAAPNSNYGGYSSASNPPPLMISAEGSGGSLATASVADLAIESGSVYYAASSNGSFLQSVGYTENF